MDDLIQLLARQLWTQHHQAIEDVVASHLLWIPEIFTPQVLVPGMLRTIIRLNDGRSCEVSTSAASRETLSTWTRDSTI